uniref:Fas binding factor 1 n=1 Tax=Scleropages formosus TaxID=113540 RepID=A0A8C9SUN6_SCLFO
MDADLFGSKKKPSSAPPQTTVKAPEVGHKSGDESKAGETENPESEVKKPSSAPTPATRGYKKFTFNDRGNSLSDLLDDSRTTEVPKDSIPEDKGLPPSESPAKKREETASPTRAPKKREELTFDDDEDDLMDALGFGESPKGKGVQKKESNPPRPARTRLDEILGRGTSPHLLERPPTGEKKEVQPEKSVSTKDVIDGEDDITFGSYQPTITLTPEGRQSRRQSVRSLQLERDQMQVLLESIQQRHRQDTELMETTHRARVKLLEESSAQREARARQDSEDLAERLASVTRLAEQERAELQAQYQRRLAQSQEDRDREVERLRDLQRKSILEMKKDHEEQVQRLKRLKDEEIDAVTSATSQTRSLTVVIEQMELFSRRLGELSSRVESTHEHTAQGLELSARQREEQKSRLNRRQNAMAAERARLKEVIAKMDIQLAEQQRQLEKERWRVTAEQAKAESAQRALDEERRTLTQHIAMEREELERAKSALLEEQQAVMQRCAEERRKLSAEWAQLHAQEKLRQERAEREASRALERDAHREGSLISMVQEQADLKLRAAELRLREEAVAKEKAELEHQRAELEREKEALSAAALRLKARAQEVEAFSKLASERYEEGERALQEARQVEAEHHTRLRNIHTQMERLRQQEQHLHQERIRLTEHRREADRLRPRIPINPQLPTTSVLSGTLPCTTFHISSPPSILPEITLLLCVLASGKHIPTVPYPLCFSPAQDRDFLQDEQLFLETLKKAPYNSAFHTA